jgi:hypothetical protein
MPAVVGEGSVDAVVKQQVGQLLLDLSHDMTSTSYTHPLGSMLFNGIGQAELQQDLDHLVQGQWQVYLPMPRLLHG